MLELKSVLAASEGGEHGRGAVITGAALATRAGASFHVVGVVEMPVLLPFVELGGVGEEEYQSSLLSEMRKRIESQVQEAGATGARLHVTAGSAGPQIAKTGAEAQADLIVVGAHSQPALARMLVGSTAGRVVRLAGCPVLAATGARSEPFARIVAAVDLSSQSRRVLETALTIARVDGAVLRALYVEEPLSPMLRDLALFDAPTYRRSARRQFEQMISKLTRQTDVRVETELRDGDSGAEILGEARAWEADLVVVGTHGFGFVNRLLLGSTALYVLRHGERATLVVPRHASH